MMGVVGTILAFVVVLVILVLVHELGHFIAAKLAGITVEEFGIGFPPRVASVIWRGTRYSLNAIPLGGFVKMLGENGESDAERMRSRGLSAAAVEHAMAGAFNRKPIWVRVLVLVAGVAMNFVLAVVLYAVAFTQPVPDHVGPLTVTSVQPGSPAAIGKSPLLVGDRIVGVDDKLLPKSATHTPVELRRIGRTNGYCASSRVDLTRNGVPAAVCGAVQMVRMSSLVTT